MELKGQQYIIALPGEKFDSIEGAIEHVLPDSTNTDVFDAAAAPYEATGEVTSRHDANEAPVMELGDIWFEVDNNIGSTNIEHYRKELAYLSGATFYPNTGRNRELIQKSKHIVPPLTPEEELCDQEMAALIAEAIADIHSDLKLGRMAVYQVVNLQLVKQSQLVNFYPEVDRDIDSDEVDDDFDLQVFDRVEANLQAKIEVVKLNR